MTCNETESQEKYSKHTSNFRISTPTPLEGGKGEILTDHHKLDTYTSPPVGMLTPNLESPWLHQKAGKENSWLFVLAAGGRRTPKIWLKSVQKTHLED